KSHSDRFSLDPGMFENWDVHLHVPEGAIPKDGPSAGITMITSLASAFTQRKIRKNIAMTGEITLRGKLLPVGGIKEKILAAKRASITEIIVSKDNERDVSEIKDIYVKGLTFNYFDTIGDALDYALLKEKVKGSLIVN
ncbi:MAG: endopeptidase La, partial [Bacteroidetes bacterium HGW-Bacteroidetes-15]